MRKYFVLLFILAGMIHVCAQRNFKSGYIITNEGDSIYGLIDFRTDERNFNQCDFKKTGSEEIQVFYPGQIQGYRFVDEGKFYVTRTISLEDEMPRPVFLEFLIQGMKNLYYYKDSYKMLEYYFFEDTDGALIPMTKKPDERVAYSDPFFYDRQGNYRTKEDIQYRRILNYVFMDQPQMGKDIESLPFKRSAMVELAKEYHGLTCPTGEECIEFENDYSKQFVKFTFSVYGGLQYLNYLSIQDYISVLKYSANSFFPVIGGQMNISSPRFAKSMSIQVELALSGMDANGILRHDYTSYKLVNNFNIKSLMGIGKLGLKYTYHRGKVRPCVEMGGSFTGLFNTSSTSHLEKTSNYNGSVTIENTTDDIVNKPLFWGWNGGVGLDFMLKNEQSILFRISYDGFHMNRILFRTHNNFKLKLDERINIIQMKVGYTF